MAMAAFQYAMNSWMTEASDGLTAHLDRAFEQVRALSGARRGGELSSFHEPLDGRVGRIVVTAHFLRARRKTACFRGKFENLLCRLNELLAFKNSEKIERAELDDTVAVARYYPLKDGQFLT